MTAVNRFGVLRFYLAATAATAERVKCNISLPLFIKYPNLVIKHF